MKNYQKCDRVSAIALALSVFLGVAAFIPGGLIPSSLIKGYLVVATILVAFIAWLLGRLIEGTFRIPWTPILSASGVFLFVMLLSALFSHTPYLSFFGEGFDEGTFAVMGSLFLGLFLASTLFTTNRRVLKFLKAFFILYLVLAVFQIVHVLFPAATSLNIFYNAVDSPVGLWSDFSFISGAVLVGSMLMLQFAKTMKKMRIAVIVGFVVSLFFVILTNIFMVWVLVGFSSILILIYTLIANRFSEERGFPFLAFALSLIALLFVLANSLFGGMLANSLHASFVDVHPSLQASSHTALLSIEHHPIVGAGPNRFLSQWLNYRPLAVNTNTLWDVPFTAGSSFLMTVGILGGALGVIAVLYLLLAFFYESGRKVFASNPDSTLTSLPVFGLFIVALYFFLSIVFFSPGIAVTTSTFIFVGAFIGLLTGEGRITQRELNFLKDQRTSFFSILCIVAFLMISAGAVYAATERFAALVYFEKSLVQAQANNLDAANSRLSQAIALSDLPLFERTRVLFAEQSIQQTLSLPANSASSDSVRSVLQNAISTGNTSARNAISIDPSDPANYIALGDMLRLVVPLKIEGVQAAAISAYQQAITLVPNYPKTYLDMAELYFDSADNTNARVYVQKALTAKSNYTDAFFLLAQIEVSDGNTQTAIQRIQDATVIDPNNPDTYFELGLLRYNSGDYTNAISAFHTTINLNNQYLNAWYYLALADQKTGNNTEAAAILGALHKRLPDNTDVTNAMNGQESAPANTTTPTPATSTPSTQSNTITPAPTTKQEKAKKLPLPTTTSQPTTGTSGQ